MLDGACEQGALNANANNGQIFSAEGSANIARTRLSEEDVGSYMQQRTSLLAITEEKPFT